MKNNSSSILIIGFLVLLAVVLRPLLGAFLIKNPGFGILPSATFRLSMSAVAIITFFGFVWLSVQTGGMEALNKDGMRLAIVASILVVDLVLVTTVIFFTSVSVTDPVTKTITVETMPDLAQSFLNQFDTVVSVAVASYLGVSGYVQVKEKKDKGGKDPQIKE